MPVGYTGPRAEAPPSLPRPEDRVLCDDIRTQVEALRHEPARCRQDADCVCYSLCGHGLYGWGATDLPTQERLRLLAARAFGRCGPAARCGPAFCRPRCAEGSCTGR